MSQSSPKTIIVGAGISGLAMASRAKGHYKVLEAAGEIGGMCKTVHVDNFKWDYAGHFLHFRRSDIREFVSNLIGEHNFILISKKTNVYRDGAYVDFPYQNNTHQIGWIYFLRTALERMLSHAAGPSRPANFLDYCEQAFGRTIARDFLVPYNKKLYATDLRRLSVGAMGRFFPADGIKYILGNLFKSASYNDTFRHPIDGVQALVCGLASVVPKGRIELNSRVVSLFPERREVTLGDGRVEKYDRLISTIALPHTLELIKKSGSQVGTRFSEYSLTYSKVLVFNLAFDVSCEVDTHWSYFPDPALSFYRIGYWSNIYNYSRLSLYVECAFSPDLGIDVEAMKRKVILDLIRVNVISDNAKLTHSHFVILDPAYVHMLDDNAQLQIEIDSLEHWSIYSTGRYARWTYNSIEDNIFDAFQLAKRLWN